MAKERKIVPSSPQQLIASWEAQGGQDGSRESSSGDVQDLRGSTYSLCTYNFIGIQLLYLKSSFSFLFFNIEAVIQTPCTHEHKLFTCTHVRAIFSYFLSRGPPIWETEWTMAGRRAEMIPATFVQHRQFASLHLS